MENYIQKINVVKTVKENIMTKPVSTLLRAILHSGPFYRSFLSDTLIIGT